MASGDLSIPMALGLLVVSAGAAIVGGAVVSWNFFGNFLLCLLCYFGLNLLYSLWLKRAVLIDVVILAALYTLRILAGGFATHTPVSQWLLSFSVFFFFGLAIVKGFPKGIESLWAWLLV
ncbi:hypothetical protein WDW86_12170 [Bdellovibrionota bacterium FG-2]